MKIKKKKIQEDGFAGSGVGGVAGIGIAVGGDKSQAEPGVNIKRKKPPVMSKILKRKPPVQEEKMITFREISQELEEQMETSPQKDVAAQIFMRGRALATAAHIQHLKTSSYSEHKALQELYDGIIPLIDSLMESFQGIYGKIENFPNVKESSQNSLEIVGNYYKYISSNRLNVSDKSEIQNDIDAILSFLNSIAYKLRELR